MRTLPAAAPEALEEAVRVLDDGGLVVLPTDTLYGLAADALDEAAVARVFEAKGRAADQALPVCVAGLEEVRHVARLTPLARRLAARFWPGPVTLVLPAQAWLPETLTGGLETVAVRVPDAAFVRDLARQFGPLTVTSANRSGAPPPATVEAARAQLGAGASLYVDGGALPGAASTIVDATGDEAKVLRVGKVAAEEIGAHGTRAA